MASVWAPQTYLLVCGAPEHRWTQVAPAKLKPVVYQPTQLRNSPRAGPAANHTARQAVETVEWLHSEAVLRYPPKTLRLEVSITDRLSDYGLSNMDPEDGRSAQVLSSCDGLLQLEVIIDGQCSMEWDALAQPSLEGVSPVASRNVELAEPTFFI